MKAIKIFLFFALLPTIILNAQVGIGTTNPNATLDIKSSNEATPANTDGILIPKIEEYPAVNPTASQDGMMVYATGNGSVAKGFYYWDNGVASWISFSGASGAVIQKLDDLTDGKSDSDGSEDGSSVFIGVDAGVNDDGSDNQNVGLGYQTLVNSTSGFSNTANGYQSLYSNTMGYLNVAIGYQSLFSNTTGNANTANGSVSLFSNTGGILNTANGGASLFSNTVGDSNTASGLQSLYNNTTGSRNTGYGTAALFSNKTGSNNTAIGTFSGYDSLGSNNIFIGYSAGYNETNSNRLHIENSSSSTPLIYGEFDNDLLRVNGDFEVEKPTDVSITAKTPFGNKSSLKLFESGGSGDYGFEFQYDGSPDKLYLWSRTFAGNEGIRMTWLKNGRVGIGTTSPNALLDASSTDPTNPKNTDGILVPRINAFPSTNPTASQNGMLVFLTTNDTFYYWKNNTTSWVSINASGAQSINDLTDGKSDNDGTQNGSSVYLGVNAGATDDLTDNQNVGIGFQTLQANSIASGNTAIGYRSMMSNIIGKYSVAIGTESLFSNTTGGSNTSIGHQSLYSNTTGNDNTANGDRSLNSNSTGNNNTANGAYSLVVNSTGNGNVANGSRALYNNTAGVFNVASGYRSLYNNTTGDNNVAIGYHALKLNTTFDNNTAIGTAASIGINVFSNTTAIGYSAEPTSSNQVRLGNASVSVIGGNAPWSNFSDKRIKTNIKEDIVGLAFIKKLRPVSYNLDMDAIARFEKTPDSLRLKDAERLKAKEIQTGFIAQEVEIAANEVGFNFHGVVKPYTKDDLYALSYSEFVVPLVKAVQEQQAEIEALKNEIAEIKAMLQNKK